MAAWVPFGRSRAQPAVSTETSISSHGVSQVQKPHAHGTHLVSPMTSHTHRSSIWLYRGSSEDTASVHASVFDAEVISRSGIASPARFASPPSRRCTSSARPKLPRAKIFQPLAIHAQRINASYVSTFSPLSRLQAETSIMYDHRTEMNALAGKRSLATLKTASFSTSNLSSLLHDSTIATKHCPSWISQATEAMAVQGESAPGPSALKHTGTAASISTVLPISPRVRGSVIRRRWGTRTWPLDSEGSEWQEGPATGGGLPSPGNEVEQASSFLAGLDPHDFPRDPALAGFRPPPTPPGLYRWSCGMVSGYARRRPGHPEEHFPFHFRTNRSGHGDLSRHPMVQTRGRTTHRRNRLGLHNRAGPRSRPIVRNRRASSTACIAVPGLPMPRNAPATAVVPRSWLGINRRRYRRNSTMRHETTNREHGSENCDNGMRLPSPAIASAQEDPRCSVRHTTRSADSGNTRPCQSCSRVGNQPFAGWLGTVRREGSEGTSEWCSRCAWHQFSQACCPC